MSEADRAQAIQGRYYEADRALVIQARSTWRTGCLIAFLIGIIILPLSGLAFFAWIFGELYYSKKLDRLEIEHLRTKAGE